MLSLSDAAEAGANAISEVFGAHDRFMCSVHASVGGRWGDQHKHLFLDYKGHVGSMNEDFERYKIIPVAEAASIAFALLCDKFTAVYHEREVSMCFKASWANSKVTRIEVNQHSRIRGGLPCDNNGPEGTNNAQKDFLDRKRSSVVPYIDDLERWLNYKSSLDLSFGGGLHDSVNSFDFYSRVNSFVVDEMSCIKVSWTCPPKFERPEGTIIFAAQKTVNLLKGSHACSTREQLLTACTQRDPIAAKSRLSTFMDHTNRTVEEIKAATKGESFDDIMGLQEAFYPFLAVFRSSASAAASPSLVVGSDHMAK